MQNRLLNVHRFLIVPPAAAPGFVNLPAEEAHHAARVLRVRVGEEVALFDGVGGEWLGRVCEVGKREVAVAVESRRVVERPAPRVFLLQAWLQLDKACEQIIRHCTALGVDTFVFFRAERSVRPPKENDKWRKIGVEVCKQCGRLWLPEFLVAGSLEEALGLAPAQVIMGALDADAAPIARAVKDEDAAILIGPEGDFTATETALALRRGAAPVSFGATIFRAEIAASVAATLVQYHLGRLGPRGAGSH